MSETFIPTARNSERWHRENQKAERYLNRKPSATVAAVDRAQALRKALALRHAHRITIGCKIHNGGTMHQRILHTLMMRLHAVREAENIERLIDRDRTLSGFIAGLIAAESFGQEEASRAVELRLNAFEARRSEFASKLPID